MSQLTAKKIVELRKVGRSANNGDATLALLQLSNHYNQLHSKLGLAYATQALERAIRLDEKDLMGEAHLHLAVYFCRTQADYVTSLSHCQKALKFKTSFKKRRRLAEVFKTIGVNYHYLGKIQLAQENYKNALEILLSISEKTRDEVKDVADLYYNLAILNRSLETLHLRKEYLEEAQKFYNQVKFKAGLGRCFDGMTVYHFFAGNKKKAMEQFEKALEIFRRQKDKSGIYLSYNNIGTLKIKSGEFEEGLEFLEKSLQLRKLSRMPLSVAISHINIGNALMDKKRFKDALPHLKAAESILRKTESRIELASLLNALARCYANLKQFEDAFATQKKFIDLQAELHRYELDKAYNDTSARYDVELLEKNATIDRLQNFEIASYIHRLEISNEELRQFAHAASHDLKEPLRTITSFVNLLEKHCERKIDDTGRDYLNYILSGTRRLDVLVKDLLNLSRINLSETPFAEVDLNAVFKDVVSSLATVIAERKVVLNCAKLPIISADKTQMYQLFLNLIGNAIKYNESDKPQIKISVEREAAHINLSFADNGIGIGEQYQEKVFDIFQRLHPREKYSGTGIGLTICKRIVDRHRGKIWIESKQGKGSVFYVSLPE